MEVYDVVNSIGGGNFGMVYLARHKIDSQNYVIKKIKIKDMEQKDRESTEQEVRLLQKLRHANIVAYKDSFVDREDNLNIVMDYCEGGDMYTKIKESKGTSFSEDQIMNWFAQILMALLFLHKQKILHRDLKTQNIFLKGDRLKLGDFGIAKVLDDTKDFANTCIGTPYYMSPELFKNEPYSYKSDVWAFGCIIYEMCNQRHAFEAQSINGLAMKILKGSYSPVAPSYSDGLQTLIKQMLQVSPSSRPSLLDIMERPEVRVHVVEYVRSAFASAQGTEVHAVNCLRDQAEELGLLDAVQGKVADIPSGPPSGCDVTALSVTTQEIDIERLKQEIKQLKQQKSKLENSEVSRHPGAISDPKARVLLRKAQRKREEELRHSEELKRIRTENVAKRAFAQEMHQAQYRPTGWSRLHEIAEGQGQLEEIPEENLENGVSAEALQAELRELEEQISAKEQLLAELCPEEHCEAEEESPAGQEDEDEYNKLNPNGHLSSRLIERIKFLRHRCEAGLGHQLFTQAYEYMSEKNVLDPDESDQMRVELKEILGTESVGYWSLLDQIVYLEASM